MKNYYCVRIVLFRKPQDGAIVPWPREKVVPDNMLFDDLGTRFMGLQLWLTLFKPYTKLHRDDDDGVCFDLLCPRTIQPKESVTWANQTAAKISSYGINAVAAPDWNE